MVEVRDLHMHFGAVRALTGISFTAPDGTITGLLGENGAGKTTTLNIVSGLHQPARGDVSWTARGRCTHRAPSASWRAARSEGPLRPADRARERGVLRRPQRIQRRRTGETRPACAGDCRPRVERRAANRRILTG